MLYLATQSDLPPRTSPELSVEEVEPSREAVRQWFSRPIVRVIGAHTGCSCGFPHVVAEEPIEYWDGALNREKFFFNEQFFYRSHRRSRVDAFGRDSVDELCPNCAHGDPTLANFDQRHTR